jgi:uncharacterized membrane protein
MAVSTRLYSQAPGDSNETPSSSTSSSTSAGADAGVNQQCCWNPTLRRIMGGIASVGVVETAYLTYIKLFATTGANGGSSASSQSLPFCDANGAAGMGCSSVLDGPYAYVPGTDHVPLALVGLVAYLGAAYLALAPTVFHPQPQEQSPLESVANTNRNMNNMDEVDLFNRKALTAWTTTMGIFSTLLMILLFGILKQQCIYCQASAGLSISLMTLCWVGGAIPPSRLQQGIQSSVGGGGLVAFIAMAIILVSNHAPPAQQAAGYFASPSRQQQEVSLLSSSSSFGSTPGTLLASTSAGGVATTTSGSAVNQNDKGLEPPPILSSSSQRALDLGNDLQRLNARLYGAYWCSHCYDQKERLGQQAMSKILYVECSKEGRNSQTSLCKEKKVPGYPTWEINGQLYPGEQALEELEELVQLEQKMQ